MKILIITTQYPPRLGGVATASFRLANGLKARGYDVLVISQIPAWEDDEAGFEPVVATENGIDIVRFPEAAMKAEGYEFLMGEIKKIGRQFKPDIIHAYYLHPTGYFACALGKHLNVPVTVSARGDDVTLDMLLTPDKVQSVLKGATKVLSVSQSLIDWLEFINPKLDALEIKNGVASSFQLRKQEALKWRNEMSIADDAIIIGANARFRWKKGMEHLVDILAQLGKKMGPKLVFVLIGDFPERFVEDTHAAMNKNGARLIVVEHPDRDRLPVYYSAFDLFLLTSIREGLSNSLLEAMACGVPIVTTPANGCEQVVKDSECGIIISPHDANKAVEDIEKLIADKGLREQFSENALHAIKQDFSFERELDEYETAFTDLHQRVVTQ